MSNEKPRPNINITKSDGAVGGWIKSNGALCQDEKGDVNDYGLRITDVPSIFHEKYIETGYRRVGLSASVCCLSIFHLNNETFNVWTNIIGVVYFILHYPMVAFKDRNPLREVVLFPLVCHTLGILATYLMSVTAHTFNCMSVRARKVCFFTDYASIGFQSFTGGMAFFFYSRPVNTEWRIFNEPILFLSVSALMSLFSTFVICRAMYHESPHRLKILAVTYASVWAFNTLPYTSRLYLDPSQVDAVSLHHFKWHCVFFVVGMSVYIAHFPERVMAGVFDIFGHSHQFMHIFIAMGASEEFVVVHVEMLKRRQILEAFPGPSVSNCFILTGLIMLGNYALLFWYSRKVYTQRKIEKKQ